ncbi:MAG: HD domain-containing protein [Deltaproteobacteria bacterium]|nr:HD domain-containing protein [Deltaproteobacteria bacterium]
MRNLAEVFVENGPASGTILPVGDKLTIGRRPENDLALQDAQMSRFHAVIEWRGDGYYVEDLGSRSGTLVDGTLVRRPIRLGDVNKILIGQTVLQFSREAPEEETAPNMAAIRDKLEDRLGLAGGADDVTMVPLDDTIATQDLATKDHEELKKAGTHLQALLSANAVITTELDIDLIFERILDALFQVFPAHRAVILTVDSAGERPVFRATRGADGVDLGQEPQISQTIVERAVRDRIGVLTLDAGNDERFDAKKSVVDQNIRSAMCVPIRHQDKVLGAIYVDTVGITHAFSGEDLRILTGIAAPAGSALRNAILVERLKNTATDTILRLAIAAEYRDHETGFHIHRMSDYAEVIARTMGRRSDYCELIKLASPMHDVGKIGIPDSILKKPARLTKDEFEMMKLHTLTGAAILANPQSELMELAYNIALNHHERFDGTGYPRGLSGEKIPIEGRIVAVADVFDALLSPRCYKPKYSDDEAIEEIANSSGKHFDPDIVEAFMASSHEIFEIREHYGQLEAEALGRGEDVRAADLLIKARRPALP